MRLGAISIIAATILAGPAVAATGQDPSFSLALIGIEPKTDSCAFVFDAQNKLGVDLTDIKLQIGGLAPNGEYRGVWLLSFSNMKDKKRQIKSFDLPQKCTEIGQFVANSFTECKGDKDYVDLCNTGLKASSKTNVGFGNDAE